MEVEVREEASALPSPSQGRAGDVPDTPLLVMQDQPALSDGQIVQVRVEEVLLVALVLVIWVAAIALFFNRWGKIRMLEPYQPKFHQQPHRPSCPLAPLSPPGINHQRMSFSKYNVNALTDPLSVLPSPIIRRPRQNSVFVGSSIILNTPPRRVKSATDIHHIGKIEHSPTASLSGSVIPIINRERRPSLITIERAERPIFISRHRPSITIERPPHLYPRMRRSSCFAERVTGKHKNFISFEHQDRRAPSSLIVNEQRSCSYHQPTISFETPLEFLESAESPDPPRPNRVVFRPKISRSFEQPTIAKPKPERMATSLDVGSSGSIDRKCSIPEEDRASPVIIQLEDVKATAPLLEKLKSSDV